VVVAVVLVAALVLGFGLRTVTGSGSQAKPSRTVTVSSTAVVKARPDEAVVQLGVSSESPSSATAFAENATRMQAVLAALASAGVARSDIQTQNVSLGYRYVGSGPNRRKVFVATNQVQATLHDLSKVGSIIDAAVGAGATSVQDIRFQVSNPNVVRTEALTQAVTNARAKADALAKAAGSSVVRVVTIQEESFRPGVVSAGLALRAMPAPTPIVPPSSVQASVTVQVVWQLS